MCTIGCDHLCEKVFEEDCPAIKMMKDAGAIILVKGNIPQLAYSLHSENLVWGVSQNPHDKERSCGGSSGGDAGLVASRCVPLSYGSDIGGSIRIPAHFNGVFGLRTSPWRLTLLGHRGALPDNFTPLAQLRPCIGPFANTPDDIKLGLQILLSDRADKYDIYVPPCPFREDLYL